MNRPLERPVAKLASIAGLLVALCGFQTGSSQEAKAPVAAADPPASLDFARGEIGQPPPDWPLWKASIDAGYVAKTVAECQSPGRRCALLSRAGGADAFGTLSRSIDATPYRGKRVRLRAAVRAEVKEEVGTAQLWLRVDRPNGAGGFFDNMDDRPISSPTWQFYDVVGPVAKDAERLAFGMLLKGSGKAWIDAVSLEVIGDAAAGNEPPRPLAGRGEENLTAFTRLLGIVRYFHPSDQAAKADWNQLAIAGIQAVEGAPGPDALAHSLETIFLPVAPTVRLFVTGRNFPSGKTPPLPAELAAPRGPAALRVLHWEHHGVGIDPKSTSTTYSSKRVDTMPPPALPNQPFVIDLGGGVSASVPLSLYADAQGTLPHVPAAVHPKAPAKPEGWGPNGDDRATRLADVALAWNVFQHFYPYFDVSGSDWPKALHQALGTAATDADETAFLDTLNRMVAELHDGHGGVWAGFTPHSKLPLLWATVEGRLAVVAVDPTKAPGVAPGDVVVTIEGRPALEVLQDREQLVSAATPQWRRYVAERELLGGARDEKVQLTLRTPSGTTKTVTLTRSLRPADEAPREKRPAAVAELRPGIFYIDLDRAEDKDVTAAIDRIAAAKGVVVDLRGYPHGSTLLLQHLIDQPARSARWNIPLITRPDRQGMTFVESDWPVEPAAPRIRGKVAFLTDGRAISYAETYLGIVEAFHLAEIVGGPTAGTNGNVNPFVLPGGYNVRWTGLKVLKHDGTRHHGVGIRPTVPAAPTIAGIAAGKDEVLEKGIEVVGR